MKQSGLASGTQHVLCHRNDKHVRTEPTEVPVNKAAVLGNECLKTGVCVVPLLCGPSSQNFGAVRVRKDFVTLTPPFCRCGP